MKPSGRLATIQPANWKLRSTMVACCVPSTSSPSPFPVLLLVGSGIPSITVDYTRHAVEWRIPSTSCYGTWQHGRAKLSSNDAALQETVIFMVLLLYRLKEPTDKEGNATLSLELLVIRTCHEILDPTTISDKRMARSSTQPRHGS